MSLQTEEQKAKAAAIKLLNDEKSWVEKHPTLVTLLFLSLLVVTVALLAHGCHH